MEKEDNQSYRRHYMMGKARGKKAHNNVTYFIMLDTILAKVM